MITVKPMGGLANRVRVLSSAVELSLHTGVNLKVIWDSNKELNCPYNSLFLPNEIFTVKEVSTTMVANKITGLVRLMINKSGYSYPFGYHKVLHDSDIRRLMDENFDFQSLREDPSVFINTCYPFYIKDYKKSNLDKFFMPVKTIDDKAGKVTGNFNENTVGVHIRRTDNRESLKYSPLSVFMEKMSDEIDNNPDTGFFLSTDSKDVENALIEKFGERIMTRDRELSRDSENGIQDALIDILCLSKTKLIIGSYYSTFSGLASRLGGIDLQIARAG